MKPVEIQERDFAEARAALIPRDVRQKAPALMPRLVGWVSFISLSIMVVLLIRWNQRNVTLSDATPTTGSEKVAWLLLAIGVVLFTYLWFVVLRRFRRDPVTGIVETAFNEHGVEWKTPALVTTWKWNAFSEVRETRSLILLLLPSRNFQVIAKRAFENSDEAISFVNLAREKIAAPLAGSANED